MSPMIPLGGRVSWDVSKFVDVWELALTVPPMWAGKTDAQRVSSIKALIENAEKTYRANRDHKPSLGKENIVAQSPLNRSLNPSFRPRIKVYCINRAKMAEWLCGYQRFVGIIGVNESNLGANGSDAGAKRAR